MKTYAWNHIVFRYGLNILENLLIAVQNVIYKQCLRQKNRDLSQNWKIHTFV